MSEFPKAGEVFNQRYELLQQLGAGGIGTVFKALQIESGRMIALKIMHSANSQDLEFKERFLREARALSQLSHPGIVTVYHIGVSDDDFTYIAMELIDGVSLRQILNKEKSLPALRAISIARQIADGLSYVHQHGIVHRDIKPENIILMDKPEPDTVKLIDFGLARVATEQKLTQTGWLIGSVIYMSPEQCQGKQADERSDIYALTICLYEMLCGKQPFAADTPVGLMYKHISEQMPSIEKSQVDRFLPEINEITALGAAKIPDNRYKTMNELAAALDSLTQKLEKVQPSRSSQSRRGAVAAVSVLIVLGLLALSAAVLQKIQMQSGNNSPQTQSGSNSNGAIKADSAKQVANTMAKLMRLVSELKIEVKRKEQRLGKAVLPDEKNECAELLHQALIQLKAKQMQSLDYGGAEVSLKRMLELCPLFSPASGEPRITILNELAACRLEANDLEGADAYAKQAEAGKPNSVTNKSDMAFTRALIDVRRHNFARAKVDLRTTIDNLAIHEQSLADRRFTMSQTYGITYHPERIYRIHSLWGVLSKESFSSDSEKLSALDLMNDMLDALPSKNDCPGLLEVTLEFAKKIPANTPGCKPVVARTLQLKSKLEAIK